MNEEVTVANSEVDYEEWYHTKRHTTHFNDDYYNARAKIALTKFFSGIDQNLKVLDYGCGLGQNIFYMPNAVGYDISQFGVEFCNRKGIKATNDIEELADSSFDIVLSAHVLEHHPHPKTMLEEIHSKLKKGGQLILVLPYERHGKAQFELDLNQHLFTWNFQTINNLLMVSGFQIKQNKYIYGAGYNKLLPLSKLNFGLYRMATNTLSKLTGIREMKIVAIKK
jgi:SAM-dependent methyltransferase